MVCCVAVLPVLRMYRRIGAVVLRLYEPEVDCGCLPVSRVKLGKTDNASRTLVNLCPERLRRPALSIP